LNPLIKLFTLNKHFTVILLTGLATATLLTSALALTNYYLRDTSIFVLKGLNYHAILYITSTDHPWRVESNYTAVLFREVVASAYTVYVEVYEIPSETPTSLNNQRIPSTYRVVVSLIYYPGLATTLLYATPRHANPSFGAVSICGVNATATSTEYADIIVALGTKQVLAKHPIQTSQYTVVKNKLIEAYSSVTNLQTVSPSATGENPYVKVLDDIVLRTEYTAPQYCNLVLMVHSREQFIELSSILEELKAKPLSIKLSSLMFEGGRFYSETKLVDTGRLSLTILFFDPDKLGSKISSTIALLTLEDYFKSVRKELGSVDLGVYEAPLYTRLVELQGSEQVFRIGAAITLIPSLIMIWLTSSKIPPILISMTRRTIAVLRTRGISLNQIKLCFALAFIIWLTPGVALGFFTGPFLSNFMYYRWFNARDYVYVLSTLCEPLTTIAVFGISIGVMLGVVFSSFKTLARVTPLELARIVAYSELPYAERGFSKTTFLFLGLGIYYVLRTTIINPYTLKPTNILLIVVQLILLLLEAIVLLFGPILLIYGIANLIVSSPEKIGYLASKFAGMLVKNYNLLLQRIIENKAERIALIIVLSSFSISLLVGGLAASDTLSVMFQNAGIAVHGNVDYIIVKPATLSREHHVEYILGNVTQASLYVRGKYTYAYILLGVTGSKPPVNVHKSITITTARGDIPLYKNLYLKLTNRSGDIPLGFILFIPENFTSLVEVADSSSMSGKFTESLGIVERSVDKGIYVFNSAVEQAYGISLTGEHYKGWALVVLSNTKVQDVYVIDNARNLPAIASFKPIQGLTTYYAELRQAEIASIPIYATIERGLVLNINSVEYFAENLGTLGHGNYALYGYILVFLRGVIGDSSELARNGFTIISLANVKDSVAGMTTYMTLSTYYTIAMGLVLLLVTLVMIGLTSYTIVYENLYNYTLMRGRGVPASNIYSVALAESFSIALLSIIPGLVIGLFLGYGLPSLHTQVLGTTTVDLTAAYGVKLTFSLTPRSLVALLFTLITPLATSLTITRLTYRRVVREALTLIGGHV